MKMNMQNPGGEAHLDIRKRGCEEGMKHGKGNMLQSGYLQTRGNAKARGMSGMSPAKKAKAIG